MYGQGNSNQGGNSNPYSQQGSAQGSPYGGGSPYGNSPYGGGSPYNQSGQQSGHQSGQPTPGGSPYPGSGYAQSGIQSRQVSGMSGMSGASGYAYDDENDKKRRSAAMGAGKVKVVKDLFRLTPAVGAVYVFMAIVTMAGFYFVSDGEMSAILVLASLLCTVSHMFVLLEIVTTKSGANVNVPSQILLAIVYITRLPALCFADQYLPVDSTGDWAYQFFEFASFIAACLTVFLCEVQYKRPAQINEPEKKELFPWWAAIPVAALLAFIFPCARIRRFALDWGWTFSTYLEAFARVPQVLQVASTNAPVPPNIGHSVVLVFFARIFTAWFYYNYSSAYKINKAGSTVVWLIVLSQLAQLFLLVDFVYIYVKHIMKTGIHFFDQGIAIHEV